MDISDLQISFPESFLADDYYREEIVETSDFMDFGEEDMETTGNDINVNAEESSPVNESAEERSPVNENAEERFPVNQNAEQRSPVNENAEESSPVSENAKESSVSENAEESSVSENAEESSSVNENTAPSPVEKKVILEKTKSIRYGRKLRGMKAHELRQILDSDLIKFCKENGLIAKSLVCHCGRQMSFSRRSECKESYFWLCRVKSENYHKTSCTIRKGTWFEKAGISIANILWLAYMWLYEYSIHSIMHECDHKQETVMDYLTSCSDVCAAIMDYKIEPLGGPGKVVELFSCEYKGKSRDHWVFCALEQYSCKSLMLIIKDKKGKTLVKIFDQYIFSDSTVLASLWGSFQDLEREDFNYLKVQKSITFYDTVTKSEIENFNHMKKLAARAPALNASLKCVYSAKFCEYIYRKSLTYSDDAYLTFLQDVAKIYTPPTKYTKA